jgi:uncharacterized pyridoxal phosphate-containing UPF0001 family protein
MSLACGVTAPGAVPGAASVGARLAGLHERIRASGRDPAAVRIVAVTKGFGLPAVEAALACGLHDLGENYAPELLEKAAALAASELAAAAAPPAAAPLATGPAAATATAAAGPATAAHAGAVGWHYLGAVQRNKVARRAPVVACWQGVDRVEEGEAIARRAPGASVLVEIDLSGLPGRAGAPEGEVRGIVAALRRLDLDVAGLMTVAPPGGGARAGEVFGRVAALVAELELREASMGMTDDLEEALTAGATMVRIGRGLFGPRAGRAAVPQ